MLLNYHFSLQKILMSSDHKTNRSTINKILFDCPQLMKNQSQFQFKKQIYLSIANYTNNICVIQYTACNSVNMGFILNGNLNDIKTVVNL